MQANRALFIWLSFHGLLCAVDATVPTKAKAVYQPKKNMVFVDGIKAVFRGSEGTDLIMASELERPRLDGSKLTLEEAINDAAYGQEARKYKLWPSPEDVDKQLRMIGQANHKTPKEFEELMITLGYTPEEGRTAFAQMNAINSLISFKITGNLVVPESDVIAYYNDHPEQEPSAYQLEYYVVPFAKTQSKEEQLEYLKKVIEKNDPKKIFKWNLPFWINENEIAADKQYILDLEVGQISQPLESMYGFELFRLVGKRPGRQKTLEERYNDIVNILRKPKYGQLLSEFQKNLIDNASIIYFDLPTLSN